MVTLRYLAISSKEVRDIARVILHSVELVVYVFLCVLLSPVLQVHTSRFIYLGNLIFIVVFPTISFSICDVLVTSELTNI